MFLLLTTAVILLTLNLIVAGLFAWLLLRPYALHLFLGYRANRLWMGIELGSRQRNLFSASAHNEGELWHARVQSRTRPVWQRSWPPLLNRAWYPILRRFWRLWKHPKRSAWVNISWRLIREIGEQIKLRQAVTTLRLGLPSYPQTGYLAAVAYPLNFTLFRTLGTWRLQVIPDFSIPGLAFENHLRCTFRGYQLLKPGYHFLNSPEVRDILKSHLSKRIRRWGRRFRH
jgi:hypothetical protein